jgi:cytochrome P450
MFTLYLLALCLLLYPVGLAAYRLFLHPIRRYPGPFINKLTGIPELKHAFRGDRHLYLFRLHQKYGPVVRYAPNKLSFNTAGSVNDIYVGNKPNIQKSEFYDAFPAIKGFPSTHSAIDKKVHGRKRRVLSHAFSTHAIESMDQYIFQNVKIFCNLLGDPVRDTVQVSSNDEKASASPVKNVSRLASYLTFDVMGELCFGKSFGMLTHPDIRFVSMLIDSAAHRHSVVGSYTLLDKLHLDKVFFHNLANRRERYMAYSRAQAAERTARKDSEERKDFFYHLLHAKDPETGEGFQMNELWSESNLLIVAGSDTSSTAIASTLRFLALYPEVRQKLTSEVRERFSSPDEIRGKALSDIPYLRACIDEAMRLAPPVPGVLPRVTLSDSVIDGHFVPAGVEIGTCAYALHHNSLVYKDSETYRPERWLSEDAPRSSFVPFSVGSRSCLGRSLAYVELDMAIARTVFMYDFSTFLEGECGTGEYGLGYSSILEYPEGSEKLRPGEHKEDFRTWDHFTCYKDGPLIRFTQVNPDTEN